MKTILFPLYAVGISHTLTSFLIYFISVGCLIPARLGSLYLRVVNKTFLKSEWRVLGIPDNREDETALQGYGYFFNCVFLATDLSFCYIHKRSLGNKMLDTNESNDF